MTASKDLLPAHRRFGDQHTRGGEHDFDPAHGIDGDHLVIGGVEVLGVLHAHDLSGDLTPFGVEADFDPAHPNRGHLPVSGGVDLSAHPPASTVPDTKVLAPGGWAVPIGWSAELVEDAEDNRKRIANRIRAARDDNPGHYLQFGWMINDALERAEAAEKFAVKALEAAVKDSPYADYAKTTDGIGLKALGRFIGAVGDPAWHYPNGTLRTRSQLQAYVGVGGPGFKHTKGRQSNWNSKARMRLWNMATPIEKIYKRKPDARYVRTLVDGRAHYGYEYDGEAWVRVSGDLTPGENLAKARRLVMRHILRDVWQIAYDWHTSDPQPSRTLSHPPIHRSATNGVAVGATLSPPPEEVPITISVAAVGT